MTRSNNKVLKIRAAKLDDTGTFACRGVNGFGKAQVNIHLIVVGKLSFELETGDKTSSPILARNVFFDLTNFFPNIFYMKIFCFLSRIYVFHLHLLKSQNPLIFFCQIE